MIYNHLKSNVNQIIAVIDPNNDFQQSRETLILEDVSNIMHQSAHFGIIYLTFMVLYCIFTHHSYLYRPNFDRYIFLAAKYRMDWDSYGSRTVIRW